MKIFKLDDDNKLGKIQKNTVEIKNPAGSFGVTCKNNTNYQIFDDFKLNSYLILDYFDPKCLVTKETEPKTKALLVGALFMLVSGVVLLHRSSNQD